MALPSLDLQDPLLSSRIPLPPNPLVFYAKFTPNLSSATLKSYQDIETARQHFLHLNASTSPLESLLASVHAGQPAPCIYVFAISSCDTPTPAASTLETLHFDYMPLKESGSFLLNDVYACSVACSLLKTPCHECKELLSSSITCIPRKPLRVIYSFFLEACINIDPYTSSTLTRWLLIWLLQHDHKALSILPPSTPTPPPPEPVTVSPLPSGTPIVLLPHGAPAYYRATYEGPTAALVEQFKRASHGLGVTNWDNIRNDPDPTDGSIGRDKRHSTFIIAQIIVENKQGADKGVLIIYPAALCLSFCPSTGSCTPLEHMLDLPAPLQPSPQASSIIPIQAYASPESPRSQSDWGRKQWNISFTYGTTSSPAADSLQRLRSLTFSSHKSVHRVAEEVGSYVEAVARERERERERLKREREGASSSPRLARILPSTSVTTPGSLSVDIQDRLPEVAELQSASPHSNFYPSPPPASSTIVVTTDALTLPVIDSSSPPEAINDGASVKVTQDTSPPGSGSSNANYDLFNNIDSTWSQPSQTYMGMDLDFDIGMGLGMVEGGNERDVFLDVHDNTEFEDAFTDDDFNFFDQPSRTTPLTLPVTSSNFPNPQPRFDLFLKEASKSDNESLSILDHPMVPPACEHLDELLPAFTEPDARLPSLSPASEQTPEAESSPMTPKVQLDHNVIIPDTNILSSPFGPIPFAPYHRVSDSKYLYGKFALSSPKADELFPNMLTVYTPDLPPPSEGLKSKYNAVTDPRVGIVQKLIGMKRKRASFLNNETLQSWTLDEHSTKYLDDEGSLSETESDAVEMGDGDSNSDQSRPTTPPPYLPLGPTLLCTHFEHLFLLSIGVPLSFPDSTNIPLSSTSMAISVPTPVSPAATLGAVAEKIKSLEAIASIVASEAVENSAWAVAWNTTVALQRYCTDVWRMDVKRASLLLGLVSQSENALNVASLFGISTSHPLRPLESPLVAVGKGGNVIHVLPAALRFWEKLGLTPKGGKKDVSLLIIYEKEDGGDQRELQVDSWLQSIKAAYIARAYGNLQFGRCINYSKPGHVPVRYDSSLRKTITSLISGLTSLGHHYALLFSVPTSAMTFASPVLRLAIASMRKGLKDRAEVNAMYELIPECQLFGPLQAPSEHQLFVSNLCSSIYDRTPSVISRPMPQSVLGSCDVEGRIEEPAFTLARRFPHKVSFSRDARSALGVVDRHTLMHVGYQVSTCGKWLVAACIDQRGEAHDTGVWFTRTTGATDEVEVSDELCHVQRVWNFSRSFSKKANLDWRITITKFGVMSETELDVWVRHLENVMNHEPFPPLQVSILCAEVRTPWFVDNTRPSSRRPEPNSTSVSPLKDFVFADVSSETFMLTPQSRLPLSLPIHISYHQSLISENSSAPSEAENATDESIYEKQQIPHPFTLLPRSSTTLVRISPSAPALPLSMLDIHLLYVTAPYPGSADGQQLHQEITYNFYELSLLANLRWKLNSHPILPFHLGAVEVMLTALERDGQLLQAMTGP